MYQRSLAEVEKQLKSTLVPVQPRAEYVRTLRTRLMEDKAPSANVFQYLILAVAGILSSVLLVATGIRATKAIRAHMHQRHGATITPA
jgi:hypothetical protein